MIRNTNTAEVNNSTDKNYQLDNFIDTDTKLGISSSYNNKYRSKYIEGMSERLRADILDQISRLSEDSLKAVLFAALVAEFVEKRSVLPTEAPEKWPGRRKTDEEPSEFCLRVYDEFLNGSMNFADLKDRDEPLYRAIFNSTAAKDAARDQLNDKLPTLKSQNDQWVGILDIQAVAPVVREVYRLVSVGNTREATANGPVTAAD
ncbi:MAG: hypothetical protein ACFB03_04130 [Paracoccaceae bacterium]